MSATTDLLAQAREETRWLIAHPQFDQKPASITEFLGEEYLEIDKKVRPGLKKALVDIFGENVNGDRIASFEQAMITGGIGIGKTTFASIALPYMAHWTLCLKDPQDFFELLPGSRIAFMQMSTSEDQALQVIFTDIKARIEHSPWFVNNYPHDPKFTKQIRFPKNVWILPGDSAETTFEGYNILAGILDEMDSHKITKERDYADLGFDTIENRISSRFIDEETEGHKGLIICIGQMKKGNGFAARKYEEMMKNPRAYVMRMTIWESLGWKRFLNPDGTRNSFWYDIKRKVIVPTAVALAIENPDHIEIPNAYRQQFEMKPEKALRDLAGIPPMTNDPFISMTHKIDECIERWIETHGDVSPLGPNPTSLEWEPWFGANGDPRRRAVHIDLATSGDGDAVGIAMGHISGLDEIESEKKPHITIDCLIRLKAMPGAQILLSDVRKVLYFLKEDLGFRILDVTMDGFQSTDTMQQLRKKKYRVEYLSVDKSTLAYEDLRDAIYENRFDFPPYNTYLNKGDDRKVAIAIQELQQLTHVGSKVDHPSGGSKDVADAMAGVCTTLMGDRTYRKGVTFISSMLTDEDSVELSATGTSGAGGTVINFPGYGTGLRAPVPAGGSFGLTIPSHLRPTRDR